MEDICLHCGEVVPDGPGFTTLLGRDKIKYIHNYCWEESNKDKLFDTMTIEEDK